MDERDTAVTPDVTPSDSSDAVGDTSGDDSPHTRTPVSRRRRVRAVVGAVVAISAVHVLDTMDTLRRWEAEDLARQQKHDRHTGARSTEFYEKLWERKPRSFKKAMRMSRESFEVLHARLAPAEVRHAVEPHVIWWHPPGTRGRQPFTIRFSLAVFLYMAGHAVSAVVLSDVFGIDPASAMACT